MIHITNIEDVRRAEPIVREHLEWTPLIRSWALERELGLATTRRIWLKDYGWTPVGSYKVYGALNWVAQNLAVIGDRPIAAHSSGNFASGISFAGNRYGKRVIIVMPENAPKIKFELTRSFGAEIRTYDIATDHKTGIRDQITREIAEQEDAIGASPYDDANVIAGHGVGGLEITDELKCRGRGLSKFICQVSGGGLMSGHAIAVADSFPQAEIIGVEPDSADDFARSMRAGKPVRIDHPTSICDGLLSYEVGEHNWPILHKRVSGVAVVPDIDTRHAMKWLYDHHGVRCEPSGAIGLAALLTEKINLDGDGDLVVTISGRNVDDDSFRDWIS